MDRVSLVGNLVRVQQNQSSVIEVCFQIVRFQKDEPVFIWLDIDLNLQDMPGQTKKLVSVDWFYQKIWRLRQTLPLVSAGIRKFPCLSSTNFCSGLCFERDFVVPQIVKIGKVRGLGIGGSVLSTGIA